MIKEIYLAGGCFWGIEAYFSEINGVIKTEVGYANGETLNPTYEEVKRGNTGYVETVKVIYDDRVINLEEILENYFEIIDPTIKDGQGVDFGSQYRTGVYFVDEFDREIIRNKILKEQEKYTKRILTENELLKNFFKAEDYHQKYLAKNPGGYCHIDLSKVLRKEIKKRNDDKIV